MTASTAVSQLLARWTHLYGHTPASATVTYLHAAGWGRFRRTSVASLVLWLVILLAGTLLHSTT